jgi:hypothetical protein
MLIIGGLIVGGGFPAHGSSHQAQRPDMVKAVIETYATMVHASYEDAYQDAQALQAALQAFVRQPSPTTLEAAKNAWKQARLPYGQTKEEMVLCDIIQQIPVHASMKNPGKHHRPLTRSRSYGSFAHA